MIQFDFESIKQRILTTLSSKSEWAEFLSFGTNSLLVDAIAQELAYEVQYKEYLSFENIWSKSRNKSSLLLNAPIHGYVIPRKIGSLGTLKVSVSEEFNAKPLHNTFIPKYFQFSNGDTYVVADNTYVITPLDDYILINAKQGEAKTLTFFATGSIYETKDIIDVGVENSLYDLYVNDILWTKVDSLFEYTGNDLVYEIITSPDFSKVTIKFGNNIFGKKLNLNDTVKFFYISTLGNKGNISSSDNITTVESQAYDSTGQPIDLYVTNTTAFVGGKDYPSIEEIRALSPKVFQAGSRASTRDDYETVISQLEYISKVLVWGAYETNVDQGLDPWTFIPTEENVVHIAALNMSFENLTPTQKLETTNNIYQQSNPTDILSYEQVEKISLIFNVQAMVLNSSYILSQVKTDIDDTLKLYYGIENIEFGTNIYNSDIVRLIDEVVGIRNHLTNIQVKKEFVFSSPYIFDIDIPVYPLSGPTIQFYVKKINEPDSTYIQCAVSNANGAISGVGGFNTLGSSINVANGKGTMIINNILTDPFSEYKIKVLCKSQNPDLLLNKRNYIFQYDSSNITVSYPF
jgi:hypothetical protein